MNHHCSIVKWFTTTFWIRTLKSVRVLEIQKNVRIFIFFYRVCRLRILVYVYTHVCMYAFWGAHKQVTLFYLPFITNTRQASLSSLALLSFSPQSYTSPTTSKHQIRHFVVFSILFFSTLSPNLDKIPNAFAFRGLSNEGQGFCLVSPQFTSDKLSHCGRFSRP